MTRAKMVGLLLTTDGLFLLSLISIPGVGVGSDATASSTVSWIF